MYLCVNRTASIISHAVINHYCMVTVNVTVGMTPEMLEEIDDAIESNSSIDSRSQFIRKAIKGCPGTPFDDPQTELLDELNVDPEQVGAA